MSELREKIDKPIGDAHWIGRNFIGFPPESKERIKNEILAAFKAHIEECKKTPTDDSIRFSEFGRGYFAGWKDGVNNDRNALMESLE